jgi:hypothetical protein
MGRAVVARLCRSRTQTGEIWTKGFICRTDIPKEYQDLCPFLGLEQLADYEYSAERFWVGWSIHTMKVLIVTVWCIAFVLLSTVIATFIVYQMGQPARRRTRESAS